MKTQRFAIGCVIATVLVISMSLLFMGPIAGWISEMYTMLTTPPLRLKERVAIGVTRDEVLAAFSDAWFHGDCRFFGGTGYDIFLYGKQDPERVTVLIVRYAIENGTARVDFIGYEEPYRLNLYERCVPASIFN